MDDCDNFLKTFVGDNGPNSWGRELTALIGSLISIIDRGDFKVRNPWVNQKSV